MGTAGPSAERTTPDPAARELTREMQSIVATDRDLHEKVRSFCAPGWDVRLNVVLIWLIDPS